MEVISELINIVLESGEMNTDHNEIVTNKLLQQNIHKLHKQVFVKVKVSYHPVRSVLWSDRRWLAQKIFSIEANHDLILLYTSRSQSQMQLMSSTRRTLNNLHRNINNNIFPPASVKPESHIIVKVSEAEYKTDRVCLIKSERQPNRLAA